MDDSATDPRLLAHEGRALVFDDIHDLCRFRPQQGPWPR
jgi:hypothetical protein